MPEKQYYQEQTQKARRIFSQKSLERDFIRAMGEVKKSCLRAAFENKQKISLPIFKAIITALDEIISGRHDRQFCLPLKQGSAGTSINMNFNEVIAGLAEEILLAAEKKTIRIDPIETINIYQSTNDVFSTAVTLMTYRHLVEVEKMVIALQELLVNKENEYSRQLITGRTEMQAALPINLGQVFGSWAGCIQRDRWRLNKLKERIRTIALGGTAIGTCFFAPREYVFKAEQILRQLTGLPLCRSQNLPDEISNQDKFAELAGGYQILAQNLFKISSDLLIYTSSMVQEITHPALQYGSTIMAAKTNPVILEYVKGMAIDIQGECQKINLYCQNGQLQLNPFLPFITDSFIQIYHSLTRALPAFMDHFLIKMEINQPRIEKNLTASLALINSLRPQLGYHKIKQIYQYLNQHVPREKLNTIDDLKNILITQFQIEPELIESYFDPAHLTTYSKEPPC